MASRSISGSPPIFIGGDGRSGTTLLSLVLNAHPELSVGPELHFRGPKNLGPYLRECLGLLIADDPRAFGKELKKNPQFKLGVQFAKRCHRFGIGFADLDAMVGEAMARTGSHLRSFRDRCALIDAIGRHRLRVDGTRRWGIKIMRDIGKPHPYAGAWPGAQFVHIIRDGRDVAASQIGEHGTWGYADIEAAASGWADLIGRSRAASGAVSILEIRYEDLVQDPGHTVAEVLEYLGLAWDDAVLSHSQQKQSLYDNPYNHPSLDSVREAINTSAVGRYREDLLPAQTKAFERVAGATLAALGYGTAYLTGGN